MPPRQINVTFTIVPVKTALSLDKNEAKKRVLALYKAWYRQIPIIFYDYNLSIPLEAGRSKLREIFVRNSKITDVRVINGLVIKGQMELNEVVNKQKEECHVYKYFREDQRKPKDFLSKFLDGR